MLLNHLPLIPAIRQSTAKNKTCSTWSGAAEFSVQHQWCPQANRHWWLSLGPPKGAQNGVKNTAVVG